MKKFMVMLFLGSVLITVDVNARYRRASCDDYCCDRVEEDPCGQPPCCVRYVRQTFPAKRVKHITYSWECPEHCIPETSLVDCDCW